MARRVEIDLEYQNYIEAPPIAPQQLYNSACSNDGITIESWRQTWIDNVRENQKRFGPFKDKGVGKLFGKYRHLPAIVAGAGPSLKYNGEKLKDRGSIPLVSCLHNFHFLEDVGAPADYYVTLDAGEITIEEVSEGGSKSAQEYWDLTKNRKLIAFIGTSPRLLEKWQGEIYFFNAPVPDSKYMEEIAKIEPFYTYISNGGNVLGASLYIAKGIFGANPIAFVGADFSFSYDKKFHAWDSKYDKKLGYVVKAVDVFGNKVLTWQSYYNFKNWFDWVALQVSGLYINCTEGGCFGAYQDGNLMAVKQMALVDFFRMYQIFEELKAQCEQPEISHNKILF
jgi:hypothetical protein